jgi:NADPH2:quinone reductase
MTNAIRVHDTGDADVMKWEAVEVGNPGPGEARIKQSAAGLNYIDVYFRSGLYAGPPLPLTIGMEAAGVVESVGDGVSNVKVGDRVTYNMVMGAYAEERVIPAERLVALPDAISDETAAAMMLKGTTAWYLIRQIHKVKAGETILIHAASGGVGLIVCQWAKHLGATVIGTVGTDAKAELAKAHGCDHSIVYTRDNFKEQLLEITKGEKVPVVYDSVGKDTYMDSLDCLAPRGTLVLFGAASGPVPPFDLALLGAKGSLFITRPSLANYTGTREDLEAASNELFDVVKSGAVKIEVNQTYALKDAPQAHKDLEGRRTTGSTVFTI